MPDQLTYWDCPNCGAEVSSEGPFCGQCERPRPPGVTLHPLVGRGRVPGPSYGSTPMGCLPAAWVWVAVGWTVLVILVLVAFGVRDLVPPLVVWLLGLVAIALVAILVRPAASVEVYGPQGQRVMVSEKEAERRVTYLGWTYHPPSGDRPEA